jgi:hypothetical protein
VLSFSAGHLVAGDDVLSLQQRLSGLGFDLGRVDGVFGVRTDAALREFQRSVGVDADGTCGPDTFRAIARLGRTMSGGGTASALREMRSSYRLRTGTRPSGTAGPGGTYDGTFVQDWEYAAGTGDLDECNGRTGMVTLEGRTVNTYHYVLTNTFPYIPRCFHATPDATFRAMMMPPGGDAGVPPTDAGGPPPADGGMTGPRACTSTAQCTGACPPGSAGCTCSTTPMGMMCVPTCTTTADCPMAPPGVTFTCRMGICAP